jgi:hypothetical protein
VSTQTLQAAILIPLVASLACSSSMSGRGGPPRGPEGVTGSGMPTAVTGQRATSTPSATTAISRRRVDAKEEPAALIAIDRTRCAVPSDKFRDVKVGDTVACNWVAR